MKREHSNWGKKKMLKERHKIKGKTEDEEWRCMQKEIKEQAMIAISSLVAVLVIIDNCTLLVYLFSYRESGLMPTI